MSAAVDCCACGTALVSCPVCGDPVCPSCDELGDCPDDDGWIDEPARGADTPATKGE